MICIDTWPFLLHVPRIRIPVAGLAGASALFLCLIVIFTVPLQAWWGFSVSFPVFGPDGLTMPSEALGSLLLQDKALFVEARASLWPMPCAFFGGKCSSSLVVAPSRDFVLAFRSSVSCWDSCGSCALVEGGFLVGGAFGSSVSLSCGASMFWGSCTVSPDSRPDLSAATS